MLHPTPLWERDDLRAEQVVAEFQREARMVRKAVTGDLTKVSCLSSCYVTMEFFGKAGLEALTGHLEIASMKHIPSLPWKSIPIVIFTDSLTKVGAACITPSIPGRCHRHFKSNLWNCIVLSEIQSLHLYKCTVLGIGDHSTGRYCHVKRAAGGVARRD